MRSNTVLAQPKESRNMCIQSSVTNTFSEIHHWIRQFHHSQRSNHRNAEHFVESTRKLHRGGENRKLQHINRYFRATCLWASKKCWKSTWLGYWSRESRGWAGKNITGSNLRIFKVSLAQGNLQKLPPCRCTVVISSCRTGGNLTDFVDTTWQQVSGWESVRKHGGCRNVCCHKFTLW